MSFIFREFVTLFFQEEWPFGIFGRPVFPIDSALGVCFRFSRNIYANVLNRLCEKQGRMAVSGSSIQSSSSPGESTIVTESMEYILTDIGNVSKRI